MWCAINNFVNFFLNNCRSRGIRPGSFRKVRRRVVTKNGECNVVQSKLSQRRLRFLQDMFTTLVDSQWRWTLLVFALSFVLSWLAFAVIWWLIAFTHGDLEEAHMPANQGLLYLLIMIIVLEVLI